MRAPFQGRSAATGRRSAVSSSGLIRPPVGEGECAESLFHEALQGGDDAGDGPFPIAILEVAPVSSHGVRLPSTEGWSDTQRVKVPAGQAPQMPREIHSLVASIAQRLGRDVAGDDLFLLALMELPDDVLARSALEAEGVTRDRVLAEVRTGGDKASDTFQGLLFPPAYNALLGRSQAFAATLGDGAITPEHVLLALIWEPTSGSSQLLWRLGVQRERIVERLRRQGIPVPETAVPGQREIEMGERVWFDRTDVAKVLQGLGKRISPGTRWGFNYEGDRAWAWAEAHVDLNALVDEARSAAR